MDHEGDTSLQPEPSREGTSQTTTAMDVSENDVAIEDRVFPHYVPNSSIKHSKSDSKDRSQEIL
jgi:hypothetical protein